MDSEIEQQFAKNYIDKNYQERLLYELGSSKKERTHFRVFLMMLKLF